MIFLVNHFTSSKYLLQFLNDVGMYFGEFLIAYKIVVWLCWIPNLIAAYILVQRIKPISITKIGVMKIIFKRSI